MSAAWYTTAYLICPQRNGTRISCFEDLSTYGEAMYKIACLAICFMSISLSPRVPLNVSKLCISPSLSMLLISLSLIIHSRKFFSSYNMFFGGKKFALAYLLGLRSATISVQADNTLYFPPSDTSTDQIPSWAVHSGDSINITYSSDYTDVRITAISSTEGSNFTNGGIYVEHLPPSGNFLWSLDPISYILNDSSISIPTFFRIEEGSDSSQYFASQNFSILQPKALSIDSGGGIATPTDASTWTGSVTVFQSIRFETGSSGQVTTTDLTTTRTTTPATTTKSASTATQSVSHKPISTSSFTLHTTPTAAPSSRLTANSTSTPPAADVLSSGASAGIYAAASIGAFILAALILNIVLLVRKRRETMSRLVGGSLDISHARSELPARQRLEISSPILETPGTQYLGVSYSP